MKNIILLCFLSVFLSSCSTDAENIPTTEETSSALSQEMETLVSNQTAFAFDLYKQLGSQGGNLFLSPYSISSALAMTYAGANGETKTEMEKVLRFTSGKTLPIAFAELNQHLMAGGDSKEGTTLQTANSLWLQTGESYLPEFQTVIVNSYKGFLEQVDYMQDPEMARKKINDWVEEKTNGRITDLLQSNDIQTSTRLVLVNAIYMKGNWMLPFKEENTKSGSFYVNNGNKIDSQMMEQTAFFNHVKEEGISVLEMPYRRGEEQEAELAMIIILPDNIEGLGDLEKNLNEEKFHEWIDKMDNKRVHVTIPKFKMTQSFRLRDPLQQMGMKLAFSDAADFSRITGKKDLSLSQVIHKTFIKVDENGTEAAAATASIIAMTSAPVVEEPVEFKADHPFFFAIIDRNTKALLFMGRVETLE